MKKPCLPVLLLSLALLSGGCHPHYRLRPEYPRPYLPAMVPAVAVTAAAVAGDPYAMAAPVAYAFPVMVPFVMLEPGPPPAFRRPPAGTSLEERRRLFHAYRVSAQRGDRFVVNDKWYDRSCLEDYYADSGDREAVRLLDSGRTHAEITVMAAVAGMILGGWIGYRAAPNSEGSALIELGATAGLCLTAIPLSMTMPDTLGQARRHFDKYLISQLGLEGEGAAIPAAPAKPGPASKDPSTMTPAEKLKWNEEAKAEKEKWLKEHSK